MPGIAELRKGTATLHRAKQRQGVAKHCDGEAWPGLAKAWRSSAPRRKGAVRRDVAQQRLSRATICTAKAKNS